jgi:hypothetical protein
MNNLEGDIFRISAQDKKMEEELKYAFTPNERLKNLNSNPESAKGIQMETGQVAYA